MRVKAVGVYSAKQPFGPMDITWYEPEPNDVKTEIAYRGICHSDLHQIHSEWARAVYPCVPGHGIVGHIIAIGDQVEKHAPDDLVDVGCVVDSCEHYEEYEDGLENHCDHMAGAYNSSMPDEPGHTLGGYSQQIIVYERYVLRIRHPQEQLAAVALLLYAEIATYSPLRHWQAGPGKRAGVAGIGGLGHMGIKLARAMGAHVVTFTISEAKRKATKALGVDEVVSSRNADEMAAHLKSFDFISNIVAAPHNLGDFTTPLKRDGTMALIGAPVTPHKSPGVFNLIMEHRTIAGSTISSIPETQEILDFCARYSIVADVEIIRADQINRACE